MAYADLLSQCKAGSACAPSDKSVGNVIVALNAGVVLVHQVADHETVTRQGMITTNNQPYIKYVDAFPIRMTSQYPSKCTDLTNRCSGHKRRRGIDRQCRLLTISDIDTVEIFSDHGRRADMPWLCRDVLTHPKMWLGWAPRYWRIQA
jgi:hypothetical protein